MPGLGHKAYPLHKAALPFPSLPIKGFLGQRKKTKQKQPGFKHLKAMTRRLKRRKWSDKTERVWQIRIHFVEDHERRSKHRQAGPGALTNYQYGRHSSIQALAV